MNSLQQIKKSLEAKTNSDLTTSSWRTFKPQENITYELIDPQGRIEKIRIIGGLYEERIVITEYNKNPNIISSRLQKLDFIIKAFKTIGIMSLFK